MSISLQLAKKRSQQNDLAERFKPPVPERPKVTFKNLQTKDSPDENVKEETMERKSEENRKDEDCGSNKIKEIKIDLNDDDTSALISDAPPYEMDSACLNLGYEGDKEEEESDDFNTSFPENEGQKEPVESVMVLPWISVAHFSKGKQHTIPEPPRNTITIEKEEDTCEGKEGEEEVISGKEVLCYAWQIAKGMVRNFSTEGCLEQCGIANHKNLPLPSYYFFCVCKYRAFTPTWPASMQFHWNKRKRLLKKRVQLPKDWFGTPTWPPFNCFGTPAAVTSCENALYDFRS